MENRDGSASRYCRLSSAAETLVNPFPTVSASPRVYTEWPGRALFTGTLREGKGKKNGGGRAAR